jgi:hypothetical protein
MCLLVAIQRAIVSMCFWRSLVDEGVVVVMIQVLLAANLFGEA